MSNGKAKPTPGKEPKAPPATAETKPVKTAKAAAPPSGTEPPVSRPPLFRRIDWLTFGLTTLVTLIGYLVTLAPDLTLEDSGELAVGSFYAAVPHAPGYPVWTVYSWLFTVLLPFSNVAWRVAVSSAVAAALANGLLGLVVSRGSSMILEGIEDLKDIAPHLGERPLHGLGIRRGDPDRLQRIHVEPGGDRGSVHAERTLADGSALLPASLGVCA